MLRVRPYKSCDANKIVSWMKDEYEFHQWCADRFEVFPITAQMLNRFYDGMAENDTCWQMTAFDESGVVGHFTMRFMDAAKKAVRFGFVIVSDELRKRGIGKEMMQLGITYAFTILKVEKITLGVFENNPNAYQCYRSVGFEECSKRRDNYLICGEIWKCIEMELSYRNWKV